MRSSLRRKLGVEAPGEARVDYAAAAVVLERSDQLARDVLLRRLTVLFRGWNS